MTGGWWARYPAYSSRNFPIIEYANSSESTGIIQFQESEIITRRKQVRAFIFVRLTVKIIETLPCEQNTRTSTLYEFTVSRQLSSLRVFIFHRIHRQIGRLRRVSAIDILKSDMILGSVLWSRLWDVPLQARSVPPHSCEEDRTIGVFLINTYKWAKFELDPFWAQDCSYSFEATEEDTSDEGYSIERTAFHWCSLHISSSSGNKKKREANYSSLNSVRGHYMEAE